LIYLSIIYLSFSACSGSMREISCGSTMPAIIISLLLCISFFIVYILVPAVAACVRHPAAA
jgi:hypothetical protein